jgi:hypothetical protein
VPVYLGEGLVCDGIDPRTEQAEVGGHPGGVCRIDDGRTDRDLIPERVDQAYAAEARFDRLGEVELDGAGWLSQLGVRLGERAVEQRVSQGCLQREPGKSDCRQQGKYREQEPPAGY